jgi:hypothetical protein
MPAATSSSPRLRGQESNLRPRATNAARRCPSHASHTNSDDPGMKRASRVPGGNRTRLASLEGWYLCQSATGTCRRKGRESNPQGREAHQASNGVPSPLGLPFRKAAAAGIEPASARLTAAHPYQHGNHRIDPVRTAGFEPAISCARSTRNARLSHVLNRERPAGVEPALPAWQAGRLPLHHGRIWWLPNCQRPRAPGGTRTLVAALQVRYPRRWTTSACQWDRWASNPHRPV